MTQALSRALTALKKKENITLAGVPDGFDALVIADLARSIAGAAESKNNPVTLTCVSRDGQRQQAFVNALSFIAPDIEVLNFPAWDCQPYDRVSPTASVTAQRMIVLARLARSRASASLPRILSTTVNAISQRLPPVTRISRESFSASPGNVIDTDELALWLENNGFLRSSTVRDAGEYAVRGGIIDLYAPGMPHPVRLDFFGDTLESIRSFDAETQRSIGQLKALDLVPMSEVHLTTENIKRFRQGYASLFGAPARDDRLYEAISEGRRFPGLEHWMPLFLGKMDTLFEYAGDAPLILDPLAEDALAERFSQISDYHDARQQALKHQSEGGTPYNPMPPDALYLTQDEWFQRIETKRLIRISPFQSMSQNVQGEQGNIINCEGRQGRNFNAERINEEQNVFTAVVEHIKTLQESGKRVIVSAWSAGSRERLGSVLSDHGLRNSETTGRLSDALALPKNKVALAVWGLETGFEVNDLAVIGEQDILGDRYIRQKKKNRRAQDFLTEASGLTPGDLVVHVDHGIGRFSGLKTIEAVGAPHDCLEIHYDGGDKLFLPVENIELLTRYGSEETEVQLDKLGGVAWQARKSRMKQRLKEMAAALMKIAAARILKEAPRLIPPEGLYDEFAARFPYDETEDQQNAIDAVLDDLGAGRPMDRLVCGDVGFGKTEVALRAAFTCALAAKQVAVVVPTTLLARQHYRTFSERFAGLPVRVAQASRFVPSGELKKVKEDLGNGTVDIVVGTHALLGKSIKFKDLGLVIVDEEQHFGVKHKERLKELRAEVHILTLTATPIPRTLQLALTGVRELSLIATPPVDRLAVRTFVMPFDPLSIREALLRERYRGGQSFYVVPRIEDLADVRHFLEQEVPEAKVAVAHGQMAAGQLEDVMTAFYEGKYDILLSTTIVESGLDIPTANTLIVHRADRFGLSQLYQLRGRVGRSKTRAYALFTIPDNKKITPQAERRLKVLQSLDTLGAGFQLASHDLDIRGAGNLLGEEQSGHIKEVGFELYQQMLEEAVAQLKSGVEEPLEDKWSPAIAIGAPVMIPESYIEDLHLRLGLYRRLAGFETDQELNTFAAELIDRFGPFPEEVDQLLKITAIKVLCRRANIDKVEGGPKGIIVSFHNNAFANPAGLIKYVTEQGTFAKVRPDMRVVFVRDVESVDERLKTTTTILRNLATIAEQKM